MRKSILVAVLAGMLAAPSFARTPATGEIRSARRMQKAIHGCEYADGIKKLQAARRAKQARKGKARSAREQ